MTRPTRRTATTAVAALGLLALAGCGSGLEAQTYEPRAAGDSSDAQSGPLTVRHVYVESPQQESGYPQGADAELVFSAATRSGTEDRLVSATSEAASSIEVGEDLVVPVTGLLVDARITLKGLTRPLRGSEYLDVTMTFASGASVPLKVPVAVDDEPPAENPDFEIPETDSRGKALSDDLGIHGGGGHSEEKGVGEGHSESESHSEGAGDGESGVLSDGESNSGEPGAE